MRAADHHHVKGEGKLIRAVAAIDDVTIGRHDLLERLGRAGEHGGEYVTALPTRIIVHVACLDREGLPITRLADGRAAPFDHTTLGACRGWHNLESEGRTADVFSIADDRQKILAGDSGRKLDVIGAITHVKDIGRSGGGADERRREQITAYAPVVAENVARHESERRALTCHHVVKGCI
eukprot:scaffold28278_cov26-Tisochrysis_lutea.AAC.5